jgi:lipid A ethanolaminephosphotransferase
MIFSKRRREITQTKLLVIVSLFFVIFYNVAFFQHVVGVYPVSQQNIGFLLSLAVGLSAVIMLFMTIISSIYTVKPLVIFFLLLSSVTAYFIDNFDIVFDHTMIRNIFTTDRDEVADLITLKLVYYLILLGILPSLVVFKVKIAQVSFKKSILYKIRDSVVSALVVLGLILFFSKFYTSFFREHKPLRYYTNPTYYIFSTGKYIGDILSTDDSVIHPLGLDAQVVRKNGELKKLIILVVGEAVRADHFFLNGYSRETNPLLKQEDIINFSKMYSCGTSTAYSVPCMFSAFSKDEYSEKKGKTNENVLDLLRHTGSIDILWRDNNSDSKGVAVRVPYQDYKQPENNPLCSDGECRDEGMLIGLDQYVEQHQERDILIVLHQMGNHGPAYYKRYPKEFEKFKPVCTTNQVEECSNEEIINSYDNALLYTDYFLSQAIAFLKRYDQSRTAALLYFSDHGESLGENSLYLHGLPYNIAPEAQTHIGALAWFNSNISKNIPLKMKEIKDQQHSHDNLFHTLVGLFEVQTKEYKKDLDLSNK